MPTHSIDRPNLIMTGRSPLNKGSIVTLIRSVEERRSGFYIGTSIGRRDSDLAYNWEDRNEKGILVQSKPSIATPS
jgi:hypothetical protein